MKKIITRSTKIFGKGIRNILGDTLIDEGAAVDSQNFLTLTDRIELIPGRRLLGAEESGNEGVLGMGSITSSEGVTVIFRKIGTTLEYFDNDTQLWATSKTGLLPDEPIHFANSFTPAGRQLWACGQDGLLKIYPSNPDSPIDLTHATKNFKGKIMINKSRMFCWGMKEDPTGLRLSKIDKDANYNTVSAESAGTGTASHYTGTLAQTQVFGVAFTKGAQVLRDDKNGNLIGDGTGTINYATGAFVLDFTTSNGDAVTADYLWEDPLTNGIADFGFSATRIAGEGNILRQDSIGSISRSVHVFNNAFYTIQDKGSWVLTISTDDLTFDNQVYRSKIGTPSNYSAVSTANGIIFVDDYAPKHPKLRILTLNQIGDAVIPRELSKHFKFDDYTFDSDTFLLQKKDWIMIECKKDADVNDTLLIYNTDQKSFDKSNYHANFMVELDNEVIGGDSTSPNAYELFTGVDDLDYNIEGYWKGKRTNIKTDDLKKYKKLYLGGYITSTQAYDIYASYDNDAFEHLGKVEGNGSYVDAGNEMTIGSAILGTDVIGGKTQETVNYYLREIRVRTPKFLTTQILIVPRKIGYFSINQIRFSDIKRRGSKIPRKYRTYAEGGVGSDAIGDSLVII